MDYLGTNLQVLSNEIGSYNENNYFGVSNMSMEIDDGIDLIDFVSPVGMSLSQLVLLACQLSFAQVSHEFRL